MSRRAIAANGCFPPCAHHDLFWWPIGVPKIGTADHSIGDRPGGAPAPCRALV